MTETGARQVDEGVVAQDFSINAEISGPGWKGSAMISGTSIGYVHVTARLTADTVEIGQDALDRIYDLFAAGRKRYLRVPPRVATDDDFDAKTPVISGFVRFSFEMGPGNEVKATCYGGSWPFVTEFGAPLTGV